MRQQHPPFFFLMCVPSVESTSCAILNCLEGGNSHFPNLITKLRCFQPGEHALPKWSSSVFHNQFHRFVLVLKLSSCSHILLKIIYNICILREGMHVRWQTLDTTVQHPAVVPFLNPRRHVHVRCLKPHFWDLIIIYSQLHKWLRFLEGTRNTD